jgi:hypothetical protein
MEDVRGHMAWETMKCVQTHLHTKIPYDGFLYGFKSKIYNAQKFLADVGKTAKHPYVMLEREFPTKMEMVKFWWPAFREGFLLPATAIKLARLRHKKWKEKTLPDVCRMLEHEYNAEQLATIEDNSMPAIYNLASKGQTEYFLAVSLFLKFPTLNNVTSNDPFIYDEWKKRVEADKPFLLMYMDDSELGKSYKKAIQQN